MAKKRTIRAPTTSSLPNNLRIPSDTPSLVKALGRLSRQSLLDLIFVWLSPKNVELYPPFLNQNSDDNNVPDQDESPYPAAGSVEEIREAYEELKQRKGGKREVVDRVLEGDWRHGIALDQLAMVDIQYLEDHPKAQTWSAFRLGLVDKKRQLNEKEEDGDLLACLPRLHAATFLLNLQREIAPLVKAHYHLARSKSYPLIYLRIFITDSPYHQPRHGAGTYLDSARILWIAFPDSSPYVYTSMSASAGIKTGPSQSPAPLMNDPRALRGIVRDALPKALSKPNERYKLEATSLTAKSLDTMLALRGAGKTNEANGVFSIFADAVLEGTPIDPRQPATVAPEDYQAGDDKENAHSDQQDLKRKGSEKKATTTLPATKRRKLGVLSRFGSSGTSSSHAILNRLDIRLLDRPGDEEDDVNDEDFDAGTGHYTMSLSFTGSNVIAGFRKLAELGIVDSDRMPSWMTGEEGVSSAVIRRGRRVEPDSR
ncbi:chromosome loss- protein [Talaromyces marneffei ATCC 18224]|uniref:CHL4 family chromosome segregation protein, putative n=1 Tax=Talaromyces marneffei (strain ATCC 18224 / CBS 334.59 / QM 7333) TaxID=441960 RepID=B6Q256_TALMQ|nr:uncharacterized protein EYB26_001234 [Talaromyces marneffei]EEA27938.1 CHL4 family chromosome segregation protein, putative [Talaromyces marneffei ATCC 18224]KAE8556397.1 hypothetical protein EYB25_001098 [Talaromyces marneffei]QGA13584.1 hypothetical protein EYB26_001234 [Talaromyces marneffei]